MSSGVRRTGAHRRREIEHGLACNGCFLVVILDLDVDDVYRPVQLAASVEQVYACKVTRQPVNSLEC